MSILIFLVILIVLILVHEFGHFIVAKKSGVRVDEFGIGFPPKIYGIKKGETEYTLNLIPFGGFVKIFGENPDEESLHGPDKDRSFVNKPKIIQIAIIVAGVFSNLLLAWLLFFVGFMSGLPMAVATAPAGGVVREIQLTVTNVSEDSPAQRAGVEGGDAILKAIAGKDTLDAPTIVAFQEFIQVHSEEEIVLSLERGNSMSEVTVIPEEGILEGRPAIGIGLDMVGIVSLSPHLALWESGKLTVVLTISVVVAFAGLIASLFTGGADLSNLAGPVGIVGLVGDAAQFGFIYLLGFTAFISINLAVINLFPFPALDGGRLFFLIIETFKGSPINPKIINRIHITGFVILILLLLLVTYNDIINLL